MVDVPQPVVVFDLDDTLYLERDFAVSGFEAVDRYIEEHHGVPGYAEHCIRLHDVGERGHVLDRALAMLGLEELAVEPLVALYRSHLPSIALAPDAVRFLDRLEDRLTAIITDGQARTQANKIRALGLDHRVGKLELTGLLPPGHGKPHPMPYESVEQWSGRAAGDHVYIADNVAKDFVTPRARGWLTIQIVRAQRVHTGPPPTPGHTAHHTVTSFDELDLT